MRTRRVLPLLLALMVCAVAAVPAWAAVTAEQLTASDVVVDSGATLSDADRAKLQAAADDLETKGFPTKFAVVAAGAGADDQRAAKLRAGIAKTVGLENIDAVLLIAPRQLGVDADAFPEEKQRAFDDQIDVLRKDPIQGAINVAQQLQGYDASGRLPTDPIEQDDDGFPWVYVLIGIVIALGAVAMTFARRAAKRAERQLATESPTTDANPSGTPDTPDDEPRPEGETPNP